MLSVRPWMWLAVLGAGSALSLGLPSRGARAGERRLTTDGALKSDPVFLDSQGQELLYVVQDRPNQLRLMKLRLSDGLHEPVHPQETRNEFEPAVSPDGGIWAFVQNRGNLSLALVIQQRTKQIDAEVKPAGGFSGYHSPAISPDGSRVFYVFADKGRQAIHAVDVQGGNPRVVLDLPGLVNWPSFAPDGKRFAFAGTQEGNFEIYTARLDGSDVRRLTVEPRMDIRPRFSPNGQRICFTSARDGNYEAYLMHADGTQVRRVTSHPERDDYPAWHPDGRRLVTVSERDGAFDLYLHDID